MMALSSKGKSAGNPSIVVNETAMRKLGFSSPVPGDWQDCDLESPSLECKPNARHHWSHPRSSVCRLILISNTRRATWPQVLYVDPISFYCAERSVDWLANSGDLNGNRCCLVRDNADKHSSALPEPTSARHVCRRHTARDGDKSRRRSRRRDCCIGIVRAVSSVGRRAHRKRSASERLWAEVRLDILRMLLWQFARPILWANVIAWPLAYLFVRRWLEGFASHVDMNPLVFLGISALALVIALATVSGHALLVARAKPVDALRYE